MTIRIDIEEDVLRRLLDHRGHLMNQVTELQKANNREVERRRKFINHLQHVIDTRLEYSDREYLERLQRVVDEA